MSRQKIENKLDEFERRLEIDEQTFTRDEVSRYIGVWMHVMGAVEHDVERLVLKDFSHDAYVKYTEVSVRILERMLKPPFNDPMAYARAHWPHCFEVGGLYDKKMRGEDPGAHPTL